MADGSRSASEEICILDFQKCNSYLIISRVNLFSKIEKNEMGGECGAYGGGKRGAQGSGGET